MRLWIIIHLNEIMSRCSVKWAGIYISDPNIANQSEFHGTYADKCDHLVKPLIIPWFHYLCTCMFQQCWINNIWCVVQIIKIMNSCPAWIWIHLWRAQKSIALLFMQCVLFQQKWTLPTVKEDTKLITWYS